MYRTWKLKWDIIIDDKIIFKCWYLLTVHLRIFLVTDQINVQILVV